MVKINAYCVNKGWLFEDIKAAFQASGCAVSEYPESDASAWICIRSSELRSSPDIQKTVVQAHNMEPHDIDLFNKAGRVIFNHPMQFWLWKRAGFKGRASIRPIGTRGVISPPDTMPERPTLGFFCGESKDRIKGSDVFERVVLDLRRSMDFDVLMLGRGLEHISYLGTYERQAAGVDDYKRIDALFCASISPGIPLSVYEACAAGKPVVTTDRWFPSAKPKSVSIGTNISSLKKHLMRVLLDRAVYFEKRGAIASGPYTFEQYIDISIRYANHISSVAANKLVDGGVSLEVDRG